MRYLIYFLWLAGALSAYAFVVWGIAQCIGWLALGVIYGIALVLLLAFLCNRYWSGPWGGLQGRGSKDS